MSTILDVSFLPAFPYFAALTITENKRVVSHAPHAVNIILLVLSSIVLSKQQGRLLSFLIVILSSRCEDRTIRTDYSTVSDYFLHLNQLSIIIETCLCFFFEALSFRDHALCNLLVLQPYSCSRIVFIFA